MVVGASSELQQHRESLMGGSKSSCAQLGAGDRAGRWGAVTASGASGLESGRPR